MCIGLNFLSVTPGVSPEYGVKSLMQQYSLYCMSYCIFAT